MPKIAAVLFDLDGTLLDSALDFHFVINQMLRQRGRQNLVLENLKHYVSNGARAMVSYAFDIDDKHPQFESLKTEFLQQYLQHLNVKSVLYPGVSQLIDFLHSHSIPWGVVTNKPALYTDLIMRHQQLSDRAAAVICPDHVSKTKPDPEPLFLACQQMQVEAKYCCYVGDHIRDIQAGNSAGMKTIGCNYGYLNKNEQSSSWGADFTVEHPRQIIDIITRLNNH
ncbi:MAG: HAD-IA family hydrolase [Pseudomonadales bacterium]|nr:HAD-IA family hydrolase [Pseudomonadales bacterium]NRA17305.1 HAD-IA family hydrolase [Oceanospirillaceae bacterium]